MIRSFFVPLSEGAGGGSGGWSRDLVAGPAGSCGVKVRVACRLRTLAGRAYRPAGDGSEAGCPGRRMIRRPGGLRSFVSAGTGRRGRRSCGLSADPGCAAGRRSDATVPIGRICVRTARFLCAICFEGSVSKSMFRHAPFDIRRTAAPNGRRCAR